MRTIALLVALAITLAGSVTAPRVHAEEAGHQKAVLITGASTGIGRNAAERLAAAGYFVYAGARKAKDIEELNRIDNIMAVRLDVTKQDEIDAAVKLIRQEGRGLWGIVNNAGVNVVAPLIEADVSELEFLFDVNVFGVFRVTKAFAPLVIESRGRIVNISSISGFLSGGGYGMYAASKHAVEAFSDSLAREMSNLDVFVAAVEPGNFASDIGLTRCKRRLANTEAEPWVYFEERRQQMLESCRKRLEAGVENEGTPPDVVSAAIEHALFDDNPKEHYLVVPRQVEAGWTIAKVIEELLEINARHDHSYTRDELIDYIDAFWPFAEGEKSFENENDAAEMEAFWEKWATRQASDQEALVARGEYLMNGVVACGNCHSPKNADATEVADMQLAGGFVIEEPAFKAYAPNITQDHETGIGSWSDEEIIRAIREGVRPDGTIIGPPMPILSYREMSDSDARALVAYLRTVAPIRNSVPRSVFNVPLPESWGPPLGTVPDVSREDSLAYGSYLGNALGHCMECHTPMVEGVFDFSRTGAGGMVFEKPHGLEFATIAANITPHPEQGIGEWTDEEIKKAITQGISRDGRKLQRLMGFDYYRNISDEDLDALIVYLRSIPPQPPD